MGDKLTNILKGAATLRVASYPVLRDENRTLRKRETALRSMRSDWIRVGGHISRATERYLEVIRQQGFSVPGLRDAELPKPSLPAPKLEIIVQGERAGKAAKIRH